MPQLRVGDLNGDGTKSTKQLTMILASIRNISGYELTETQEIEADYNGDGKVDMSDLTFATNYLANNNTADEYFDPNEISGQFKIKSTYANALYISYKRNQDKNYLENPHYDPNYNQ